MKTRKILSVVLSLVMILTALPLTAVSSFAEKSGDFEYQILDDGTAEITNYKGSATELEIPSILDGYTVTSIGACSFENCISLISIVIPNSVKHIGAESFFFCTSLTSIEIPNSITEIDEGAFYGCKSLTSVKLPNNIKSIEWATFRDCVKLEEVALSENLEKISDSAFQSCTSLTKIDLPNSLREIGREAFWDCSNICEIKVPENVTAIKEFAFCSCTNLVAINVDEENLYYSSKNGVLFNKDLTILKQYPNGNSNKEYTVPEGVVCIDSWSFTYSEHLEKVILPKSVNSIGTQAFAACESLKDIIVDSENNNYCSHDGVLFDKDKNTLIQYPMGYTGNSYVVPDTVEIILDCNNKYLVSLTLYNNISEIEDFAFSACENLKEVHFIGNINEWEAIFIDYGNEYLEEAVIYCNDGIINELEPTPEIPADLNGDGNITVVDAKWVLQSVAGTRPLTAEQKAIADVNNDGNVTVVDAKWILQAVAGMRVL